MLRRKLIVATVVTLSGVSVALAVFALTRVSSNTRGASGGVEASASAQDSPGRHGGTVFRDGALAVEVVLSEKPGDGSIQPRTAVFRHRCSRRATQRWNSLRPILTLECPPHSGAG